MKLKNKVCLITGSSKGIGKAIALGFAKEGGHVIVTYRSDRKAAVKTAAEIGLKDIYKLDVSKKTSVQNIFTKVKKKYGKIDVLVNNAGVNKTNDFDKLSEKDWDYVMDTNLKGVFFCCQEVLKHMPNKGKIINIGSLSGEYGGPRTPSYAAAKAGVMSLTHCLARFTGKKNINVNCISPGIIAGEFTQASMAKSVRKIIDNLLLIKRPGKNEDIVGAAIFLATKESEYITGQTISINGGAWVR